MINNNLSDTILFYLRHAKNKLSLVLGAVFFITLAKISEVQLSVFYGDLINSLNQSNTDINAIYRNIYSILLFNFVLWLSWRITEFSINFWQLDTIKIISQEAYSYLLKHSKSFFVKNFSGSIAKKVQRLSNSFESMSDIVLYSIYPSLILVIFSTYTVFNVSSILGVILLFYLFLFTAANIWFAKYRMKFDLKANKTDSKIGGFLVDTITNIANVQLFGALKREIGQHKKMTERLRKEYLFSYNMGATANALQALLTLILEILFVVIGLNLWLEKQITTGDFVLFQGILFSIFGSLWDFGRNVRDLSKSISEADEMMAILNTPYEISDSLKSKDLIIKSGKIVIKDLKFGYKEDKLVLNNINIEIPAKNKIALVSKSGEGKSTLAQLLLRVHNIPNGSIFIDDQDIMEVTIDSLRNSISYVPQDPVLFHRTVRENIAYGRPEASQDEIINAAKRAQCHDFISKLPMGYDSVVGERGLMLSGGERQRISIARAILQNCPIIILDEATSALDSQSEQLIQSGLKELFKNKTAIVIAHRLSTINTMDEIIVIEKGKITERGAHHELIAKLDGHYQKLWSIQSGGYDQTEQIY